MEAARVPIGEREDGKVLAGYSVWLLSITEWSTWLLSTNEAFAM